LGFFKEKKMGRALKIQKTNTGSGTSVSGNVTSYNQNVLTDAGFPNFGSLTNPVYNTPVQTLNDTEFLGVVGGSSTDSTASTTFPEISAVANVSLADGTYTGYGTARIVRQKGSHKFLVSYNGSSTTAGSFIVGQAYKILSVGTTTDWNAVGHGDGNAAAGDEFTATAVGSGNGTAYPIGQCVLSNTATPAAGFMSIAFSTGDSAAVYASYITNKWVRDWNGMTYGNYSNSNLGTNSYSSQNDYVTNFFTDEGNVTVSGGELSGTTQVTNPTIQLAQIASVTS
jgi:hypothetical protein